MSDEKKCSRCKQIKHRSLFNADKQNSDRLASRCKPCNAERAREWAAANPRERVALSRSGHIRRKYGLSMQQYNSMLDCQDGRCAICRGVLVAAHTCVDHDHDTGGVRGILCRTCNTGLGNFKDEPIILESALQYLLSRKGR